MAHQPQNLVATPVSTTSVLLSWDDVDTLQDETYDIERDGVIVEASYAGTTFTDTGLNSDTDYTYRVRAVGGIQAEPLAPPVTVAAATFILTPVISVIRHADITPTTVSATLSIPIPDLPVEPATIAATTTVPTPSVSTTGDASTTPGTAVVAVTIDTPAISAGVTLTLTTVSATTTVPTPDVATAVDYTDSYGSSYGGATDADITLSTVAASASIPGLGVDTGGGVTAAQGPLIFMWR